MTEVLVFDLDGTLVDSAPQIVAAMCAGYAAAGREAPDPAAIRAIIGLSLPLAVERLSPGIDTGERDRIVAAYRAAFAADSVAPPLYPGAAAALRALSTRRALHLAIATGKARRGLVKVLGRHALLHAFRSLHCGDEHPSKPDPAMLRAALAAAGARPEQAAMVGDSVYDMQMARAAGVRAVGVSWGYHTPAALVAAGAEVTVDALPQLLHVLDLPSGEAA